MKNESSNENKDQNVFPAGRWTSVPVRKETLGYMISAKEIMARAIEQLEAQAKKEAGI